MALVGSVFWVFKDSTDCCVLVVSAAASAAATAAAAAATVSVPISLYELPMHHFPSNPKPSTSVATTNSEASKHNAKPVVQDGCEQNSVRAEPRTEPQSRRVPGGGELERHAPASPTAFPLRYSVDNVGLHDTAYLDNDVHPSSPILLNPKSSTLREG